MQQETMYPEERQFNKAAAEAMGKNSVEEAMADMDTFSCLYMQVVCPTAAMQPAQLVHLDMQPWSTCAMMAALHHHVPNMAHM